MPSLPCFKMDALWRPKVSRPSPLRSSQPGGINAGNSSRKSSSLAASEQVRHDLSFVVFCRRMVPLTVEMFRYMGSWATNITGTTIPILPRATGPIWRQLRRLRDGARARQRRQSGAIREPPGNLRKPRTAWWRRQSPSNLSLGVLPLLTGKNTANLIKTSRPKHS
jgi:hypothetical protein